MINSSNPQQHELLKEILKLTMLLKAKHPEQYGHLDETPVLKSTDILSELKSLQDYRNTLQAQLKDGVVFGVERK